MNIHEYYAIIKGKTPSVVSSSSCTQQQQTLESKPHSPLLCQHRIVSHRQVEDRSGLPRLRLASRSTAWLWAWAWVWLGLTGSGWVLVLNLSRLFSRLFGVRVAFHVYINKSQRFSRLTYCNLCLVTALYRRKRILITC